MSGLVTCCNPRKRQGPNAHIYKATDSSVERAYSTANSAEAPLTYLHVPHTTHGDGGDALSSLSNV